ncbi:alpha/beta hydrolase [Microbacterium sp. cf046]|uniref:alpha/beta hydrolase n=1 Tax=Microbacterium sp. cf046 TaxID=1761803 RepID=UPI000B8393DB|nr:alpha/beta hydrolase [Microbacterium sp. cf046]
MTKLHPELRAARFIPKIPADSWLIRVIPDILPKAPPLPDTLTVEDVTVPGLEGEPDVGLRIYRPTAVATKSPALFWIHGGGFVSGTPENDESVSRAFALELGMTVVALRYRLAPQHPSPAAVHDAYAGLRWVFEHADERGIDTERIAIGGASAGGGLAATLALFAHDRGEVRPAFQLLVYPMLDDRTVTRTDHDTRGVLIWIPRSNHYGWTSYLGTAPGSAGVSPYAAAARREDLSGLPPAWIGVGTLDLFHDEDLAYARRLNDAGVPCELVVVPGAFHGFDRLFTKKPVAQAFWASQLGALRGALGL